MIVAILTKPPNSVFTYEMDWSDLGETITSSSWTASGLTTVSSSFGTDYSLIKVSGGEACTNYQLINYVNTNSGQVTSRSVILSFRNW